MPAPRSCRSRWSRQLTRRRFFFSRVGDAGRGSRSSRRVRAESAGAPASAVTPASAPWSRAAMPRGLVVGPRRAPRLRGRSRGRRRVGREQLPVEPLQLGTGIHAKLVRDDLLRLRVRLKRLGAPAASSRARISSAQSRSRIGCSVTSPRSSATTCAARPQARSASMRSSVAASHSSAARSACVAEQRRRRDVGEQRPAPQPERLAEQRGGALRVAGRQRVPALGDQRLELLHVQVARCETATGTRAPGRRAPGPRCRRSPCATGARRC